MRFLSRIVPRNVNFLESRLLSASVEQKKEVVKSKFVKKETTNEESEDLSLFNSNRAKIAKINRLRYLRHYPTLLVNPDGSSITIRYQEPRMVIRLPFDISGLSGADLKYYLEKRKPKTRVNFDDSEEEVSFNAKKYLKFVK